MKSYNYDESMTLIWVLVEKQKNTSSQPDVALNLRNPQSLCSE